MIRFADTIVKRKPAIAKSFFISWVVFVFAAFLAKREEIRVLGPRLLSHIAHVFILLLILLIAYSLGKKLFRLTRYRLRFTAPSEIRHEGPYNAVASFFYIAIGFGSLSLIMFLLGILKLYYAWTAYALLASGVLLSLSEVPSAYKSLARFARDTPVGVSKLETILLGIVLVALLLGLCGALSPPFLGDDMVYHLNTPKTYIKNHGLVDIPYNVYTYFPMGMEMLYVFAMLILGDVLAKLIHYAMGALVVLAIYFFSRRLGLTRSGSLLAAAMFCTVPTAWMIGAWGAYVDLALAFFILLAVFAFIHWFDSDDKAWLVLCGWMLGFALATKFTAIYLLPVLIFGLCIKELLRVRSGEPLRTGALFSNTALPVALSLIIASPWYIKNVYYVGNPFFPFFLNLIAAKSVGWDAERAGLYLTMLGRYGGEVKSLKDYLLLPWNLTMNAKPIIPRFFDGIMGPIFLITIPALFFHKKMATSFKIFIVFSSFYLATWMFSSQQMRFLVPVFPCLSILAALSLCAVAPYDPVPEEGRGFKPVTPRKVLLSVVLSALLVNLLIIIWLFVKRDPLPYLFGLENRREYLTKYLDYFSFYDYINKNLPESSKVFLVNMGNFGYYLERDYFSDSIFEDHTIAKIVQESNQPEDILKKFRDRGITHLLYPPKTLLSDPYTPFSDDQTLGRFLGFLKAHAKLLKADANFHLWEIEHVRTESN